MKKIKLFILLLFAASCSYANYTGTVSTSQSELTFSTLNGYNVVSLKGGEYTSTVRAPQMPVKTLSFLIPIDQKVSSVVINSTTVQQISGSYMMYPVQKPVPTSLVALAPPFDTPDPAIYNSTNPYPGITYSVSADGYPMGYHVVTIKFYPLQFVPANHILNLYTAINFTIVYATNTYTALRPNRQSVYSNNLSQAYIKGMVANPNDLGSVSGGAKQVVVNTGASNQNLRGMNPISLNSIPDYIIITSPALVSSFQPLADWKIQKGVNTLIVTTQDIYNNYAGYDNAEKIRNYLKDVFVNFGSHYVLLGGDVRDAAIGGNELIPTRMVPIWYQDQLHPTNYYYATIEGNWNNNKNNVFGESNELTGPELARVFLVGRAPVHNPTDASNFVNKIIRYENFKNASNQTLTNLNYPKSLSFWADDVEFGSNLSTQLDAMQANLLPTSTYTVLKLYQSTGNLTHNNAFNAMNSGSNHLIYHLDHSGPEGMSASFTIHEGIGIQDMDALTNGNYCGIFYSDGCDPNDFEKNSVSEHFVNNANGGGVAFLGNSDAGLSGDHDYFEKNFMDALYNLNKPASKPPAYDNSYYHIGYLNDVSTRGLELRQKNRNLLGDPEMMVWTAAPKTLGLTSTYSATNKTITGTVSGLSSTVIVTITAWKGTEIWQTKDITTSSASVAYTLSNVQADTPGNITVTATAHNYLPKVNTVVVPSPISGAHPYLTSYTINDNGTTGSIGNNDHFPDAGETIALPVTLTNSGSSAASGVTATLTWTADNFQTQTGTNATITINPTYATSTFSTIAASGGTGNNNSSPFRFTVNKNAFEGITPRPLTQFINFTLTIYINGTSVSTKNFILQITEPNLTRGENTVTGTLAANSTGNQLAVKLYNIGLSTATGLTATLSKTSSNITLTTATSPYPNITGVNTTTNAGSNVTTFKFNMGSAAYSNETFTLTVTNTFGKTWTFSNFNLIKPIISAAASTMGHLGYLTAIEPYWNLQFVSGAAIKGYNIFRLQNGIYVKLNSNLLPYASYLDQNLAQLTQYYYKVTAVDVNGNESAFYPSTGYLASTTLLAHTGWPVTPEPTAYSITGGRCEGSPIAYDLLGDKNKELFFTSGFSGVGGVWAFKNDGSRWFSYDNSPLINGYINFQKGTSASPAIADVDNNGKTELAVTHQGSQLFLYKTSIDNPPVGPSMQPNFPISVSGSSVSKGTVYADIDNDGKLEIIRASDNDLKVFNSNGTIHNGWANITGYNCGFSMPVAFDFNGDGKKEIVIGCTGVGAHPAGIYIFNEDGTPNAAYTAVSGNRCDFPPIVADINNDGFYEVLFISAQNTIANIYAYSPRDNGLMPNWNNSAHQFTITSDNFNDCPNAVGTNDTLVTCTCCGLFGGNLSVGDLNKDGNLEVIAGNDKLLHVWNNAGGLITDISIPAGYTTNSFKAPIIADVDSISADLEIIVAGATPPLSGSNVYAFKVNVPAQTVSVPKGFPISIPDAVANTPCVDDIDNNGTNELIVTTGTKFYVWNSKGAASNNGFGWTSYRHDNYNSGVCFNSSGGFLNGNDFIIQNETISTTANKYRFYTGDNIKAGATIVLPVVKPQGPVIFKTGTTIIMDATNSVLLKDEITIEAGCKLEIR